MRFSAVVLLFAMLGLSSCSSYLTKSGRQQASYERYVRRSSHGRIKLQHRMLAAQKPPKTTAPSDPVTTTSTGPESVTSAGEAQ